MEKKKNNLVMGILAHVDAGKTTLAEAILYETGSIRRLGRVDHKDAFLDTFDMEKERGITIFSKQAQFSLGEWPVTLLDTPGHVDFSAEMERTLQVLDYAILVISGADGIQGHDLTLWNLLKRYGVPVFLFINKMDQNGTDREALLKELRSRLSENCVDFGSSEDSWEEFCEEAAVCDETLLEQYLESGELSREDLAKRIAQRMIFPCYFGSALKNQGVTKLLDGIRVYGQSPEYPNEFGAKVYKISRDSQGNRLTHMKITGGRLRVKEPVQTGKEEGASEKPDQIRVYSGAGYQMVREAEAGMICAVTGFANTRSGQGLGREQEAELPVLEPVLTYGLMFPDGSDIHGIYLKLLQLEEEEPQLRMVWDEEAREIHVQVMGEVQIEILKRLMKERFGVEAEFGAGAIVYKETIREPVEGVGHFEPLRHYAEVHLLLEPTEPGSGLTFESRCSEDLLDRNWQRLILTHLEEKQHRGVLTGAEITDMRITLMSGKAHLKHTEGGDFRQATYRAVRQGLKSAESILLEPVYRFRLEVPSENVGRAMTDIGQMHGEFQPPAMEGEYAVLTGTVPVESMRDYQKQVTAYTRGRGRLFCTLKGYEPCHNTEEILEQKQYDSEKDLENPTGSVFCAHGAGFVVPWDQVPEYMHLESVCAKEKAKEEQEEIRISGTRRQQAHTAATVGWQGDKELEEIFTRTYGSGKESRSGWGRNRFQSGYEKSRTVTASGSPGKPKEPVPEYLLVDGYNIIFAWEDLKELAKVNMDSARGKLMDLLCNYQGYRNIHVILVFDAYKVEGGTGSVMKYHNIHVIYTREAETADQYIEKTVQDIGRKYHVTVATSDALEQRIIWGAGASRLSAEGLRTELESVSGEIRKEWLETGKEGNRGLFQNLPEELAQTMEEVRLGKRVFSGADFGESAKKEKPGKK